MRTQRIAIALIFVFVGVCVQAQTKEGVITVTGRLTRAMGIGGESTGWMIQFESETSVDGKPVHSIEVAYRKIAKLEELADKLVKASGKISHRQGVETGQRSVLEITSIKELKDSQARVTMGTFSLIGSEWVLEDLGGGGVVDQIQATLSFPDAGKIAGNGSCNRFFGTADIHGDSIKLGPLGSTRMACAEAAMSQETKYLKALQAAERFEWKDPYLLIYCKGFDQPLRFARMPAGKTAPSSQ